jgi:hypothetical protein
LQIRQLPSQPARNAMRIPVIDIGRPIADILPCIVLAQTVGSPGRPRDRRTPQTFARGIERPDHAKVGQEGEHATAAQTLGVLKEKQLTTMIAVKHFHETVSRSMVNE